MNRPRTYYAALLGAPGGGKGTISKYLVRDFGFVQISTGNLLRQEVAKASKFGLAVKDYLDRGALVPDDVVLDLVNQQDLGDRVLFDGFPRTVAQAKNLTVKIDAALKLDVPFQVIIDRLAGRWVHAPSGRTYAYDFNPPKIHGKDDPTGEPLTQRDDDKPDTVRARLEAFEAHITPLVDYYHANNILYTFAGDESKVIYRDFIHPFFENAFS